MQTGNFLGIYIAKGHASVVCIEAQGGGRRLLDCFSVSLEKAEPDFQKLAGLISAECEQKQLKFKDAAVALDCSMFMQHSVHSEFSDIKKITQTVRFDAEEALGTDATDVAIAFRINSADQTGSDLSVFTASKKLLGELLGSLAGENIDPVSIEPDICCLARFVAANINSPVDVNPLFAFLSKQNGYFLAPLSSPWQGVLPTAPMAMRTFLLSAQNRTELLARQVSMTAATLRLTSPVNRLEVFDSSDSVNFEETAKKLTIQTERIDIIASTKISPQQVSACPDLIDFSIAYGAAIAYLDWPRNPNWRNDFMPYQGRKLHLQNTLKYFSAAVVILMLAIGVYGFMRATQMNSYRGQLREKFEKEYSSVMFGQKWPDKSKEAVRRLGTALRRIKDAQKGSFSATGEEAVTGKLVLVLQAFNKCASATGLNIESVTITDKSITISGDTTGPENTLKVFEALKQSGLNVLQQRISSEGGRSIFSVTVEPAK